jgi:asparagine synthase (glutamine-hydrolysing)
MSRWLAGMLDPRGTIDAGALARLAADAGARLLDLGPLRIAYDGPEPPPAEPWCLLDGWLDNAEELAIDLGQPASASPEQLIAAGWRRWGSELPSRLRGDFVLVVWDRERASGLLARDQLGARSLYLHGGADGLRFAGEVRDLLALLPRRPGPDRVSLAHWLSLSERPGSATLFEGIRRLDPATALSFGEGAIRQERYWQPRFADPPPGGQADFALQVRDAFERAVRRRLDPDAPTGVLMSGGLDSASVAAVAAQQAPGAVRAYSGIFPEHPAVDEAQLVRELRQTLGLPGVTAEVRPGGLLASAIQATCAWQMPLVGWGEFWVLPLLRAAAQEGVRVVLGGDGGDELFGARSYLLADRLRGGHPLQAVRLAFELPGAGYGPPRRELAEMIAGVGALGALPYRLHRLLRAPFAARQAPAWLTSEARSDLRASSDPLAWKRLDGPRWWANIAHGLTRGIEETGVFEQQRRTAAAAGLQARHPLLDFDLVELGMRLPPLASFDRYLNRPVLRAATAGVLPDAVRLRPQKVLFDALLVDCLAGPDGEAVRGLLTDPKAELRDYVDPGALRAELLDSDRRRREQPFRWMWQVWRLCTAEIWLRAQAGSAVQGSVAGVCAAPARVSLQRAPVPATESASYVFPP